MSTSTFVPCSWLVASFVVASGCSSKAPRPNAGAGGDALAAVAVDDPTREPDDPPLILACRNQWFSGTAPVDLAVTDGGLLVASERGERLYFATVDLEGRVQAARSAGISEKINIPDMGDPPEPQTDAQGDLHFTFDNPDARLIDVEVDQRGKVLGHRFQTPAGRIHGGRGARTTTSLLTTRSEERGPSARWDGREVLDLYDLASGERTATIDPDCSVIAAVVVTAWGFAMTCKLPTDGARDFDGQPEDYQRSVIGVVDGAIAWRVPLPDDVWSAALGTDGTNLLVVENVSPGHPEDDDGTPFPVRARRLDSRGQRLGEPVLGQGRIPDHSRYEGLRLIWTGKEYAAIEWESITRYDSHGTSLGTWRFEPDCAREYADVNLVWTGAAYAVCGWYRTVFDRSDPLERGFCQETEDKLPGYPNRVYDPAEAERRAEVVAE